MGDLINKADVLALFKDKALVEEIAQKVVDDPDALANLAGDIADEMGDALEDNPEFKQTILNAAYKDKAFKKRIVNELVKELGD